MRLILALLALMTTAQAQAPSYLAMCHKNWNCSATLQTWSGIERIKTGWLENTFAADCKCADKLLQLRKPKTIRVHLINSPCMRNGRCGRYEVLWGYNKASASRAVHRERSRLNKRFNAVLERFRQRLEAARGRVQCYVSPCLECDLNERARRTLLNRVSAALPSCILVDNPYRHRCIPGTICETHGYEVPKSKPCITDMDGLDGSKIGVKGWIANSRHCAIKYYWEPWMNCIRGGFVDPRRRDCGYPKEMFNKTRSVLCRYFYPSSVTCSR